MKKIISILIIALTFSLAGCGAKKSESYGNTQDAKSQNSIDMTKDKGIKTEFNDSKNTLKNEIKNTNEVPNENTRKLIKKAIMQIESNTFDKSIDDANKKIIAAGGYIENSNITGKSTNYSGKEMARHANFVARIPSVNYEKFLNDAGSIGNIIMQNRSAEDVTSKYFDTEAHLKALKIQEERLLELLKKSGELKDIIAIEKELTEVRYQIENLTGTLKKLDNLVNYTTVNLNIDEVFELTNIQGTPVTVWDKTTRGFVDSVKSLINILKGFVIVIGVLLPYVLVIGIVYLVLRLIFKIRIKDIINKINKNK